MDSSPSSNGAPGVYSSDQPSEDIADPRLLKMHVDGKRGSRDRQCLLEYIKKGDVRKKNGVKLRNKANGGLLTRQVSIGILHSCMKEVFSTNAIHDNVRRTL
jgi:hypothetical protein